MSAYYALLTKTRRVALLILDPPPDNSTTMHSMLARKDKISWRYSLFAWSGKIAVTFEQMVQFQNPSGFIIS